MDIKEEILKMVEHDQLARKKKDYDLMSKIDQENTKRIKEICDQFGLITISSFGETVSNATWLLVQHADHDPDFQEKYLNLMKNSPSNVLLKNIAYLEDRVLKNKGLPQKYGTQFVYDKDSTLIPYIIENIENIDERRLKMGLEPWEEYSKNFLSKK
jgi:hypothetical protein